MRICDIRVDHLSAPLGFGMNTPVVTWRVEGARGKRAARARVCVLRGGETLFTREGEDVCAAGTAVDMPLLPRTRYTVRVTVWDETGDTAAGESSFETGKRDEAWAGGWIRAPFDGKTHPAFTRRFTLDKAPASARLYITGLGLYHARVNGKPACDEALMPFYNDYNNFIQCQTWDVGSLLHAGENEVTVLLGKGWYMGRFGFGQGWTDLYGDTMQLLCELRVDTGEGETVLHTGDGQWTCAPSFIKESGIYDGEQQDYTDLTGERLAAVPCPAPAAPVIDRVSPPVRVTQTLAPERLLTTPKGETVLDFGQVMTGYAAFSGKLARGQKLSLKYGELLQEGCFYQGNLRTAKCAFSAVSDGESRLLRPYFTFYGFRYVLVEGLEHIDPADFTACVVHSDLARTGHIETANIKLNRLIENALWSQRGNFVDTPTDCPQRDERMGWTGDAQVFAPTACYNLYTPAFYKKYLYDMLLEQRLCDGRAPHVVPDVLSVIARIQGKSNRDKGGSCAWSDAACVIPWTVYRFYGDKALLRAQYENMTLWAEWIHAQDAGDHLWRTGFHYADWLALDNPERGSSFGGTDKYYVASAYYYYSTLLCARAAEALGLGADQEKYARRAESVRQAIRREYFTATGRIAVPTQTALALAIYFDFAAPEHAARLRDDLKQKLLDRKTHLDTGFVGTYFLLHALTKCGLNDMAVTLLLNEDYPSWLYEVNMGATTIWERWNSVLENGLVSDTGMNSMNHYAYGSVVEWIYDTLCGLKPDESAVGFKRAVIAPRPDARLSFARCAYLSAMGLYRAGWRMENGKTIINIEVPFDCEARFIPPCPGAYTVNGKAAAGESALCAGQYEIVCGEEM